MMSIVIRGGVVVLLLHILVHVSANEGSVKDVVATFSNPYNPDEYNRLAVHKETGNVYVGAVNRIYQLDKDLQIIGFHVTTGQADKNVTEVFVIDYDRNTLISCGGGNCSFLNVSNITNVKAEYNSAGLIDGCNTSVVAFIGLGHLNKTVLYVGTSTNLTAEISDRSLVPSENFEVLRKTEIIHANPTAQHKGPINFVFGFSAEGYSFYLLNNDTAKIVRVRQDDTFSSGGLHEMEISCEFWHYPRHTFLVTAYVSKVGQDLANLLRVDAEDDILFAIFSSFSYYNTRSSIVCYYSVKSLISSTDEIRGRSSLTFSDLKLTSISAASVDGKTIMFVGTNEGRLKRFTRFYYTYMGYGANQYDDQEIKAGSPILPGMLLDNGNEHIYVLTKHNIFKIRVGRNCFEHDTCEDCVRKEQSCEWCTAINSCSGKEMNACAKSNGTFNPYLFVIPSGSDKCHLIKYTSSLVTKVTGDDEIVMLNLTLARNRYDSKNPTCIYKFSNERALEIIAKFSGSDVLCLAPPKSSIPEIVAGQRNHVTAQLSITYALEMGFRIEHFIDFFTLYDCGTYTTCTSCVQSQFNCGWCFWEHRCKDRNNCNVERALGCPYITTKTDAREFLIPYGTVKRVEIQTWLNDIVSNKPPIGSYFHCRFNIEGRIVYTNSILVNDSVHCDAIQFVYNANVPYVSVPVDVFSSIEQHISLDNPNGFTVVIYRCQYMADDCSDCMKTEEKFRCGWCDSMNQCTVKENCGDGVNWMSANQGCPSMFNRLDTFLVILLLLLSFVIAIFVILYRRKSQALNTFDGKMCAVELQVNQNDGTNLDTSIL